MKISTKISLITFTISIAIYIIAIVILKYVLKIENLGLIIIIAAVLTAIASPKKQIIQKQSGEEIQLKWWFLKKVLVFPSKV